MSSQALGVCVTLVLSSFLIQQQWGEGAVNSSSATAQPLWHLSGYSKEPP